MPLPRFVCLPLALAVGVFPQVGKAQSLNAQTTPLTAWIDLRPAAPEAGPQTAPPWVEAFEFIPAKRSSNVVETVSVQITGAAPDTAPAATEQSVTTSADSVYRIRVHRPAAGVSDLQVRVFYDDRPDGHPYLSVWNELGTELMRSDALGQGLGLASSDTMTVPMDGADYLEVAAPGDGSQLRAVFLTWLEHVNIEQPADFVARETTREPFGIQPMTHTSATDSLLYGVVRARLQGGKATLLKHEDVPVASYEFQLERQPLVAVVTFEVLGTTLDAGPTVSVNGAVSAAADVHLPDLSDPGYQGQTREGGNGMSFRYTGWVHAQKVIPGRLLSAGLNNLAVALSDNSEPVAIRSVQLQLKYNWEKLDYLLTPTATSAQSTPASPIP